jgi:hypothetical protein
LNIIDRYCLRLDEQVNLGEFAIQYEPYYHKMGINVDNEENDGDMRIYVAIEDGELPL